jgi:hypothetical protein
MQRSARSGGQMDIETHERVIELKTRLQQSSNKLQASEENVVRLHKANQSESPVHGRFR